MTESPSHHHHNSQPLSLGAVQRHESDVSSIRPVKPSMSKMAPEDFSVDGSPRCADLNQQKGSACSWKRKRDDRKTNRNLGLSYINAASVSTHDTRILKEVSKGLECKRRQLSSTKLVYAQRNELLNAFWDIGDL